MFSTLMYGKIFSSNVVDVSAISSPTSIPINMQWRVFKDFAVFLYDFIFYGCIKFTFRPSLIVAWGYAITSSSSPCDVTGFCGG